jgi:peptidoglycan/LPS O-acetylase OafA/YrhL
LNITGHYGPPAQSSGGRGGTQPPDHTYRPDIDGLRAIAVLSVIGFHAFPRSIPGGFVGVDVFFVISGFLISGLILKALRDGKFSYWGFYARRIRRIFPALVTVVTATLIGGAVLLFPDEYEEVAGEALAGIGFFANFFFWSESGYFDATTQLKPLLHLWSLGIEEQFYIAWPLLLVFLYRRTRHLSWIIGVLLLASFLWNIATVRTDPTSAFYLPLTRFWELLLGSLLALNAAAASRSSSETQPLPAAGTSSRRRSVIRPEVISSVGLLLIGAAVFRLNERQPFPGWLALVPTVGACLVIAGGHSRLNRVVLASQGLTFIGLISYPLYLWHWVLLTAVNYVTLGHASHAERLAAIGSSFLFAWLTYVLIETPIRFGKRSRIKVPALAAFAATLAGAAIVINLSDGAAFRYPANVRRLATFHYDAHRDYREDLCQLNKERPFSELDAQCVDPGKRGSKLLVLWGDSHASALYQGIRSLQAQRGDFRIAQFTAGGCPPLLGIRLGPRSNCREFSADVFERIRFMQPDIVIMGGSWYSYARQSNSSTDELLALQRTVAELGRIGIRHIVVFGNLPVWKIHQPNVGIQVWRESHTLPSRTYAYFDTDSARFDSLVSSAVSRTQGEFISPIQSLCSEAGCLISTDPATPVPVTWDYAHLTDAGSRLLVSLNVSKIFGHASTALDAALQQ